MPYALITFSSECEQFVALWSLRTTAVSQFSEPLSQSVSAAVPMVVFPLFCAVLCAVVLSEFVDLHFLFEMANAREYDAIDHAGDREDAADDSAELRQEVRQ
jgi:hypothetical protein